MKESPDIYAMTNPALCALLLSSFARGYKSGSGDWPEMPAMFLALPIVLSGRLTRTLKGTNRRTGLFEWIARNPQIPTVTSRATILTRELSRISLLFATRYNVLTIDPEGRWKSMVGHSHTVHKATSQRTKTQLRIALRLGAWIGDVRSPATVFHSLGMIP